MHSPLSIDVDLRYTHEVSKFCNITHAKAVHDIIVKEIEASFILEENRLPDTMRDKKNKIRDEAEGIKKKTTGNRRKKVVGYLMQKPRLRSSDKDGFHLVYPDIILHEAYRREVISHVNDTISSRKSLVFPPDEFPICRTIWYPVVDSNVVKGFWCAPGSAKMGGYPYVVTAKFTGDGDGSIILHDKENVEWTNPKTMGPMSKHARELYFGALYDMNNSNIFTALFVGDSSCKDDALEPKAINSLDSEIRKMTINWELYHSDNASEESHSTEPSDKMTLTGERMTLTGERERTTLGRFLGCCIDGELMTTPLGQKFVGY